MPCTPFADLLGRLVPTPAKPSFLDSPIPCWLRRAAVSVALICAASWANAQYPVKPITLLVPFAPGGTSDLLARKVAAALKDAGGQPVVVDNKPGAGGTIASKLVAKSRPDGYTLVMTSSATMAVAPAIYKDFDARELVPISVLVEVPFGFFARSDLPATDAPSLIALGRKDPGALRVAVSSLGSHGHLTEAIFEKTTHTKMTVVPYKGTAPAIVDLAGGHVDLIVSDISGMAAAYKGGKVKALFVTTSARLPSLPEIPTAREQGLAFESTAWFGLAAPRGTPPEVLAFIQQAIEKSLGQNAAERARLEEASLTPVFSSVADAQARLDRDASALGSTAASLNLPAN